MTPPNSVAAPHNSPDDLLERAAAWRAAQGGRSFPRELAEAIGTTEAELLAAECDGERVIRLRPDFEPLVHALTDLGELKAITRNAHAVIEKNGTFDPVEIFRHGRITMGNVLDAGIDLRLFLHQWGSAFALRRPDSRYPVSIQLFDRFGGAVHKVFGRSETAIAGFDALVDRFRHDDQARTQSVEPRDAPAYAEQVDRDALLADWAALEDTHQFFGLLRRHRVQRTTAMALAEGTFTRAVGVDAVQTLLDRIRETEQTVMIFVGNTGCYQIHIGPVQRTKVMGEWFNIFDPGFEFHLRASGVDRAWVVRKPTAAGDLHSLEAYDADGQEIALLHMKRADGEPEAEWWRALLDAL